ATRWGGVGRARGAPEAEAQPVADRGCVARGRRAVSESVFVQEAPTSGQEFAARPGVTFGREGCDVVLSDPEVSRRHAVLRESETGLAIEDLGSTNGTYVNDER